jgi:hypothetical protein
MVNPSAGYPGYPPSMGGSWQQQTTTRAAPGPPPPPPLPHLAYTPSVPLFTSDDRDRSRDAEVNGNAPSGSISSSNFGHMPMANHRHAESQKFMSTHGRLTDGEDAMTKSHGQDRQAHAMYNHDHGQSTEVYNTQGRAPEFAHDAAFSGNVTGDRQWNGDKPTWNSHSTGRANRPPASHTVGQAAAQSGDFESRSRTNHHLSSVTAPLQSDPREDQQFTQPNLGDRRSRPLSLVNGCDGAASDVSEYQSTTVTSATAPPAIASADPYAQTWHDDDDRSGYTEQQRYHRNHYSAGPHPEPSRDRLQQHMDPSLRLPHQPHQQRYYGRAPLSYNPLHHPHHQRYASPHGHPDYGVSYDQYPYTSEYAPPYYNDGDEGYTAEAPSPYYPHRSQDVPLPFTGHQQMPLNPRHSMSHYGHARPHPYHVNSRNPDPRPPSSTIVPFGGQRFPHNRPYAPFVAANENGFMATGASTGFKALQPAPQRPSSRDEHVDFIDVRRSSAILDDCTGRTFELVVRQQPDRARVCGFGGKDRRPIDPPPIVELVIRDKNGRVIPEPSDLHLFILHAGLLSGDGERDVSIINAEPNNFRSLMGCTVSNVYSLQNGSDFAGNYFFFSDLSVRMDGVYCLKFSLVNVLHVLTSQDGSSSALATAKTAPFRAYTAKRFPGMLESSDLMKALAYHGVKMVIRKEGRAKSMSVEPEEGFTPEDSNRASASSTTIRTSYTPQSDDSDRSTEDNNVTEAAESTRPQKMAKYDHGDIPGFDTQSDDREMREVSNSSNDSNGDNSVPTLSTDSTSSTSSRDRSTSSQ